MALFKGKAPLIPDLTTRTGMRGYLINNFSNFGTAFSALAGNVTQQAFLLRCNSGGTVLGYAGIRFQNFFPMTTEISGDQEVDFDTRFLIGARFRSYGAIRNGNQRFYMGGLSTYTIGDPTKKTIGFRVLDETIYGCVHNGTSYSEPVSNSTILTNSSSTAQVHTTIFIENMTGGVVNFYVNGNLIGTTSGGPTGKTAAQEANLLISSEHNGVVYLDFSQIYIEGP